MLPSSATATATSPTVFWPKGCTKDGLCYGWTSPALCIAGVLDELTNAEVLSGVLSRSSLWDSVKISCGGDPAILGRCQFSNRNSPLPSSLELWDERWKKETYSFVLYHPHAPNSLRFYVLEPPRSSALPLTQPTLDPYNALAEYDFTRPSPVNLDKALSDTVVNQLNASFVVQAAVNSPTMPPNLLPRTAAFLLTLASYLTLFSRLLLLLSRLSMSFTNMPILPDPIPFFIEMGGEEQPRRYLRLKDISATVQQLDVRIEQATFFITQIASLQRQNTHDVASYAVRYTDFFNTVWLIMNDMTLGLAFGTFLSENSIFLAEYINTSIKTTLFRIPLTALHWLNAWPAGLKLNAELSHFYVTTLVGLIDAWDASLPLLSPQFINTLGFLSSSGGLTLLLSVLSDLIAFVLAVHLRIGYELTRGVYWAMGVKLGGGLLWGVFRGKRRNVLRNRTDTWSYDIDQLLFGTVLFTLLAFLFPTALVYYVLFAGLRLATLLIQAIIETLLAFMHHFPLFALMLWIKDPWRLPGGVFFSLKIPSTSSWQGGEAEYQKPAYLSLENQPIPLSSIFFQYNELWNRLAKHYSPLRLLYRVLSGQHLASIPPYSIRYASGPEPLRRLLVQKEDVYRKKNEKFE